MSRKSPETKTQAARRKEREVLDLRLQGKDFDEIAGIVGYANKSGACRAYHRALQRISPDTTGLSPAEERQAERTLELARLDKLHAAVWPRASRGSLTHVDMILKIEARRDKLLGLSRTAALEVPAHGTTQTQDGNVVPRSRLEQMRARLEAQRAGAASG